MVNIAILPNQVVAILEFPPVDTPVVKPPAKARGKGRPPKPTAQRKAVLVKPCVRKAKAPVDYKKLWQRSVKNVCARRGRIRRKTNEDAEQLQPEDSLLSDILEYNYVLRTLSCGSL